MPDGLVAHGGVNDGPWILSFAVYAASPNHWALTDDKSVYTKVD